MAKVELQSPWWGAWKKFGWKNNTPGLGVSESIIIDASARGQEITIVVGDGGKYGTFVIDGRNAEQLSEHYTFMAKGTKLRVIPESECRRV